MYIILYILYMLYICKSISHDHDFKGNCGYYRVDIVDRFV